MGTIPGMANLQNYLSAVFTTRSEIAPVSVLYFPVIEAFKAYFAYAQYVYLSDNYYYYYPVYIYCQI